MNKARPFSKYLFSLLIFVLILSPALIPKNSLASHIMGYEITAEHIGNNVYIFTYNFYRDMGGIPGPSAAYLYLVDNNTNLTDTVIMPIHTVNPIPFQTYGVEIYVYRSSPVQLVANTVYDLSTRSCCRNAAIINFTGFYNASYSYTQLTVPAIGSNSTPVFLAHPVNEVPINTTWQYNPIPFDADGDSLVWSIDTSLLNYQTNIPGWFTPPSNPVAPLSMNSLSAQITWNPNTLGYFSIGILVEEYRNGIKIGEITREMQMIVIPDSGNAPRISNFDIFPVSGTTGTSELKLKLNTPYSVTLISNDINLDIINFVSLGEPYTLANNPATFTSTYIAPGQTNGEFSWTPIASQHRQEAYRVLFRVDDGRFTHYETLLIRVLNYSSVDNQSNSVVGNLYPNPTQYIFILPFELKRGADVQFELYDIIGNKVADDVNKYYSAGMHTEKFNIDLPAGNYIIRISADGEMLSSKKFLIK